MELNKQYEITLKRLFPEVLLDKNIDGCLLIRTDNWMIDTFALDVLEQMGLRICAIMADGGRIELVIDRESSRKALKQQSPNK